MITLINTVVGESKGVPRVWFEGGHIAHSFLPGDSYTVIEDTEKNRLILKKDDKGEKSVSKRTDKTRNRVKPLVELRDKVIKKFFDVGMALRISVRSGVAIIEAHCIEKASKSRVKRFVKKVKAAESLDIGSVFTGGGILDRALHDGLLLGDLPATTKFAVEKEQAYLDIYCRNQSDLLTHDSVLVESDVSMVGLSNPPKVDVLVAGIPCTGASKAGKSKLKLRAAESHPDAGACFFPLLNMLKATNAAVAVFECVPEYIESSSMEVIKAMLVKWKYDVSIAVLNGNDFGALEGRKRMALVATSSELGEQFDFSMLKQSPCTQKLSDVLEDIPDDSDMWKSRDYLLAKEIRDSSAGKGFKRDLYVGNESKVNTIRREYHKAGSCDQYLIHPSKPEFTRLFTEKEHAAIKGVPGYLIDGVSRTKAHQILGQGVVFNAFVALGEALAKFLRWVVNGEAKPIGSTVQCEQIKDDIELRTCVDSDEVNQFALI